eukprot:3119195-Rhodomonas_salina.1
MVMYVPHLKSEPEVLKPSSRLIGSGSAPTSTLEMTSELERKSVISTAIDARACSIHGSSSTSTEHAGADVVEEAHITRRDANVGALGARNPGAHGTGSCRECRCTQLRRGSCASALHTRPPRTAFRRRRSSPRTPRRTRT